MVGDRFLTVMHCRIRNNCSNLHADLFINHLRTNPTCQCSNDNEDASHFFFDCEMYITCCKCAWGKFRQLLPLLTNRQVPLLTRGKVYSSCVRSVMLHAAETWAMKADTLNRLRRNDRAMIHWICNVKAKDEVSSDSLLTKLGIQDLDVVLRTGRMRWFGHVERSTGWISGVRKLNVVAQKRSGRPRKLWDEVIKNDRKKLDMDSADP